jgi:hypothetical protein
MLERQMNRLTEELFKIDAALRKNKKKETDAGKFECRSAVGRDAIRRPLGSRM